MYEKLLIREENFITEMKEAAEPYLESHLQEFTLQREEHHPIHCVMYSLPDPKGVIVISHGFTETAPKYREMAYYFLRMNYAVYIPEHCGHGKSYRLTDDPYKVHVDTYHRYVDDLLAVSHSAKAYYPMVPLFLYAHSMGGGIGAAAAAREPNLYEKVILNAPMIRFQAGRMPWFSVRLFGTVCCAAGKGEEYAPGQHPYSGREHFEHSAAVSRPRFDYYQEIRQKSTLAQMNGATCGWIHSCARMDTQLQRHWWKKIRCPILLFQADNDTFVVNKQQDLFVRKLKKRNIDAGLIHVPDTRHEIFSSHDDTMEFYLQKIFEFLSPRSS